MVTETKHALTRRVLNEGPVTLEVKQEDEYPVRYTIIVGPEGNPHNTRLDLGVENWQALLNIIEAL